MLMEKLMKRFDIQGAAGVCGWALVGAIFSHGQAHAAGQQPEYAASAAESGGVLEEVVVTAQRRSRPLQDVPISIGVLDGESLEEQNIRTLEVLSTRQASIVVRPAPGGDQIAIRGMSSGFNSGFEQSVATFVDGVYRPRARSSRVALFDIERVETLRGPQTTFFGANAVAGALNITTRKPGNEFGANALIFFSPDENEYTVEGGIDVPVNEALAFRLAARETGMDALSKATRLDERGDQETRQLRWSMRAEPSDLISIDARFDYARARHRGDNALEIVDCPPDNLAPGGQCAGALARVGEFDDRLDRRYGAGFFDELDIDLYEGAVTTTINLPESDLVLVTGYQDQQVDLALEQANFPISSPLGVSALIPAQTDEEFEQFSQEIRWQSAADGPITYMIGGYFESSDTSMTNRLGLFQAPLGALLPAFFDPTDLIVAAIDTSQESKTWSGFAALSYDLTEKLTVSGGLRYSHVEKEADRTAIIGTIDPFPEGTIPPMQVVEPAAPVGQSILAGALAIRLGPYEVDSQTDDEWMPSVDVTYELTSDLMIYGSYAHGFKAGGFSGSGADIFGPEIVDSYEVGAKASWLDRRLMTNVALFRMDYDDLQEAGVLYTPSGAPLSFIGNVAESRAEGVEAEVNFQASSAISFRASVGYLSSEYRSYSNAPCSPYQAALSGTPGSSQSCPQDLSGVRRSNAPEWSGSVGADYEGQISPNLWLQLGSTLYFRTDYFLQTLPEDITSQDGFEKVDFRVAVGNASDDWSLALIVQNAFDRKTSSFAGHAPTAPGTTQRIADRGRSIGLQFTLRQGGGQ